MYILTIVYHKKSQKNNHCQQANIFIKKLLYINRNIFSLLWLSLAIATNSIALLVQ